MKNRTYLSTRLGNGAKVVDHVGLGHTDTRIADGQDLVLLVRDDANEKLLSAVKDRGVSQ